MSNDKKIEIITLFEDVDHLTDAEKESLKKSGQEHAARYLAYLAELKKSGREEDEWS